MERSKTSVTLTMLISETRVPLESSRGPVQAACTRTPVSLFLVIVSPFHLLPQDPNHYDSLCQHTHTRTHAHAHARTHTHTRTNTRTHTHQHTRTHAHTPTHTHARTHTHTRAHTRTHTHQHTRTHTTHTHTHTHTVSATDATCAACCYPTVRGYEYQVSYVSYADCHATHFAQSY
jgi:hypothetical protein